MAHADVPEGVNDVEAEQNFVGEHELVEQGFRCARELGGLLHRRSFRCEKFGMELGGQRGGRRRWICNWARNGTRGCAPIFTKAGMSSLISASRWSGGRLNWSA